MLTANYHTHTKRCGHAVGEDEDYVLEALGHGYRTLGFSDHVMLPGFKEPYKRGDYDTFENYCQSIRRLAEKYQGRIDILLGVEAEAFPCYYSYYKEMMLNGILDYMILGNHCAMSEDHEIYCRFDQITSPSQLYLYKELAVNAISSGMFKCFAHPDYFMLNIQQFDQDCKKISRELIETCIAYDVPLEINVAGIRNGKKNYKNKKRWVYPTEEFFALAGKYSAKCIFGQDAHAPKHLGDDVADYAAVNFAKKHNLIVLNELDVKR